MLAACADLARARFRLKNLDFLLKSVGFLLKNVDFTIKQASAPFLKSQRSAGHFECLGLGVFSTILNENNMGFLLEMMDFPLKMIVLQ